MPQEEDMRLGTCKDLLLHTLLWAGHRAAADRERSSLGWVCDANRGFDMASTVGQSDSSFTDRHRGPFPYTHL